MTSFCYVTPGPVECVVEAYEQLYLIRESSVELHLTGVCTIALVKEGSGWKIRNISVKTDAPYEPGDVVGLVGSENKQT